MLTLPIPMIVALVLAFLLVRARIQSGRFNPASFLLVACALQAMLIALVRHYGFTQLHFLQPLGAACIPPIAHVTLTLTARRAPDWPRDAAHLAAPAFMAFCILFAPATIDIVLPILYVAYAAQMLVTLRSGADTLPLMRLQSGDWPRRVWQAIAVKLILSAVSDVMIAAALMLGHPEWMPVIISLYSSLCLLAIGTLCLSPVLDEGEEEDPALPAAPAAADPSEDAALMARLEDLLTASALYRDPDLTLAKLARKLGVPAKTLSATINRATGESVSRYVNAHRIAAACALLRAGESVTTAMLDSGFNTKSNFNREFLRITAKTPSVWRADAVAEAAPPPLRLSAPALP